MTSLNLLFIDWWYREGYSRITAYFKRYFVYLADQFSVKICITTLFEVWRRDYTNTANMSLQERFQAMIMDMASRFIGFLVKSLTLLAYLCTTAFFALLFGLILLIWIIYPLLLISLLVLGLAFIFKFI